MLRCGVGFAFTGQSAVAEKPWMPPGCTLSLFLTEPWACSWPGGKGVLGELPAGLLRQVTCLKGALGAVTRNSVSSAFMAWGSPACVPQAWTDPVSGSGLEGARPAGEQRPWRECLPSPAGGGHRKPSPPSTLTGTPRLQAAGLPRTGGAWAVETTRTLAAASDGCGLRRVTSTGM